MVRIPINTGGKSYLAVVGSKLIETAGPLISDHLPNRSCAVIADTNSAALFGTALQRSLAMSQMEPALITIRSGERSKTLNEVGTICDQMLAAGLDRESFVIGLGGGVVGDISGFAAAVFQRGIPHVQIPTTLLAMVDSSIGGKTGVNTASGKNLIGAVHPPALVIDDIDALRTLPEREFKQGFGEIIKHAIIADAELFEELRGMNFDSIRSGTDSDKILEPLIRRNIEIKEAIVRKDELDRNGVRALLNFGHTVGHGIERAGGYAEFLHGEAISLGMIAAANISMKRDGLHQSDRDAIIGVLERARLPTGLPPDFPREKICEALKFDKKFQRGQIRFVMTPRIGSAYLSDKVTFDDIREAVATL